MAKKVGRPTKLTPAVIDALCDVVETGANYADVAAAAGVSSSALSNWRNAGAEINERVQQNEQTELTPDESRLWDFWKRFVAAEAQGAINAATVVYNAAMREPEWALKWLERRRPEDWAMRQQTSLDLTSGGKPIVALRWPEEQSD